MEKIFHIYNQMDCYLRIYSKNTILGGISYYAERHCDGKICRKYKINSNVISDFLNFYQNIFHIINRQNWSFNRNTDNLTHLRKFIESPIYRKMWDYFLGGLHIKFSENEHGFTLTANENQFHLVANKEMCRFRIIGNPKFKTIDPEFYNYNDCDVTLTREEGELFLSALSYKLQLELSNIPMFEIKTITNVSSSNYHLIGLTINIHEWYKSISYRVLSI